MATSGPAVFTFVMIKPSHYDDDGYPIQWWQSDIPSNTLAALNGLALDCKERRVLGPEVDLRLVTYDETNSRIRPERIIADLARTGGRALIGFVGVQSNQFPRAVDLARSFRAAGLPVMIGGFHVSGCLAMLKEIPPEIAEAQALGISFFAGEAEEGRLDGVLRDAWNGTLRPLYNYMDNLPSLAGEPTPFLPAEQVSRTAARRSSFDLGRGCPFQCSFCTIINVQGRKSRYRTPDDLEGIVRANARQGITRFFITDDNFARNRDWEAHFDRLIKLREEEGFRFKLIIQVDTLCHRIPRFIEKARRAGVNRIFIGLENINPDNLLAAQKRQNKITEYRDMLLQWRAQGVTTYAGYILGFPKDTKHSILRDVEIIKRELPLDVLEFFYLTPLPGSQDHKTLLEAGVWMDPDLNKYDLNHRLTHHPLMSDEEWEEAYRAAWRSYYSFDHMRTVVRRAMSMPNGRPRANMRIMLWFDMMLRIEGLHPLEGGLFRLKHRKDRRPGLPLEHPLVFYPKVAAATVRRLAMYGAMLVRGYLAYWSVLREGAGKGSEDVAIKPVEEGEQESLDMFHATAGGEEALEKARKDHERSARHKRLAAAG